MKRTLFFILFLLTCISIAQAENRLDIVDNKVIAETNNYVVHFDTGTITYLHNKLTGETYTTSEPSDRRLENTIGFAGKLGRGDEEIVYVRSFQLEKVAPLKVYMIYEKNGNQLINIVSIDATNGDLIIQQEAVSEKPSLSDVKWTINNVDANAIEIIIPSNDGLSIDTTSRDFMNREYPSLYWQAQLAIFQGQRGGFFVRSTDTDFQRKDFTYNRESGIYRLRFRYENEAPFTDKKDIESVEWRLNFYDGGWRVPARQYRDWMQQAFQPQQPPEWAKDIDCLITVGHSRSVVRGLYERGLDPKRTLLVAVASDPPVDDSSIEKTIKPNYARTVAEARKYGFKIMVSVNFLGVFASDKATFEMFEKYQLKNPYSGGGRRYGVPGDPGYHIFINPASAEFRRYFVRHLRRIYDAAACDGFFLDVNHIVMNHAHGEIDGLSMVEGSIRLHQELREAMPGIYFIGEGVHEVTYTQENFSQHSGLTSDTNPHPISTFLFNSHVKQFVRVHNISEYPIDTIHERFNIYKNRGTLPGLYYWHANLFDLESTQKWLAVIKEWQHLSPAINLEFDIPYQPHWTGIYLMPTIGVPADVNGDMVVNILDLVAVADHFGTTDPRYDVNYDGVVNILDLVIVANHFSQ